MNGVRVGFNGSEQSANHFYYHLAGSIPLSVLFIFIIYLFKFPQKYYNHANSNMLSPGKYLRNRYQQDAPFVKVDSKRLLIIFAKMKIARSQCAGLTNMNIIEISV